MKRVQLIKVFNALIFTICTSWFLLSQLDLPQLFAANEEVNVITATSSDEWFQNEDAEGQGTWTVENDTVKVDAFGCNYAMEGATYLTGKGVALGAYEFQTTIKINELNKVQNPMVGIIPWYIDNENYLAVQLKFTDDARYVLSADEKADGYAIEQVIFTGKYNGEGKYYTATAQQENTTIDALTVAKLKEAKKAPTNADGHTIKVRLENNSATATSYKATILYNDVEIGTSYAYFYNAIAKNLNVGFMAQDVKAEFSNAIVTDFTATNNTVALARDWKENNGFTYRVLNGIDVWTFNSDDTISFDTTAIEVDGKKKSEYKVTGSNIAGYDTNRGFMDNAYKATAEGLPQNYELEASFKLDEVSTKKGSQGYGLLAWYKDDQNFVDVTFRRTKETLAAKNEIVLYGWIECSSATIGENIYELPKDFDLEASHTLRVQKKSTGFYVYLDDIAEPIISKIVKGTETNYYYGYEGYNAKFTAGTISAKAIYESYDEIAVLDENATSWRVSGVDENTWKFADGKISINAKANDNNLTSRSYILGASDISDINMKVEVNANITLGSANYAELMLSPYIVDENNYARIGLAWKDGKTYARLRAATFTEEDIEAGLEEARITLYECEIANIDLSQPITVKAEKINTTLALYVNDVLVYGRVVENITTKSEDYGVYLYNMDLVINELSTIGYKKYELSQVGDWTTSGMKYNEWTIDENGYLAGDATYTPDMEKEEEDANNNFAIKENAIATAGNDYEMTVTIKATAQSEAEDRVGVVMWYVDEDNYILFYMDRWRADSTVPRTTIFGKLGGETLPTTFNHGGWFKEGDHILDSGLTQTEASQVTEWHTIKVIKEGNTFTCYVDTDDNGYISYVVAAGLPDVTGKTIYSGIYALNDAVLVSAYDVTEVNQFTTSSLPCEADNPYNASIAAPTLGNYDDNTYVDEFDSIDGTDTPVDPSDKPSEPSDKPSEPSDEPSEPSDEPDDDKKGCSGGCKGGCGGSLAASFIGLLSLMGAVTIIRKKKSE